LSAVLDTHVWIWWLVGQSALSDGERESLDALAASEPLVLPAVCLWEAQMLNAKRRLDLDRPFDRWLREASQPAVVRIAPLDVEVVLAVDALPKSFHGDRADRLIVGTARALDLPLATHDKAIRRSRLVKLWRPS
jgi:PIN domain nuclease of toxin-antitoxin system